MAAGRSACGGGPRGWGRAHEVVTGRLPATVRVSDGAAHSPRQAPRWWGAERGQLTRLSRGSAGLTIGPATTGRIAISHSDHLLQVGRAGTSMIVHLGRRRDVLGRPVGDPSTARLTPPPRATRRPADPHDRDQHRGEQWQPAAARQHPAQAVRQVCSPGRASPLRAVSAVTVTSTGCGTGRSGPRPVHLGHRPPGSGRASSRSSTGDASSPSPTWVTASATANSDGGFRLDIPAPGTPTALTG